jgi:Fur family ferric uptake transcriptional regulator
MRSASPESRRSGPVDRAARTRAPARRNRATAGVPAVSAAEEAIRATGARVTQGRIRVLEVLQRAARALTHHEIEAEVAGPLDRVTVYRVLDWLTRERIAHKIPGDDRVWRFTIAGREKPHQHAHFQCTDCSQVICLEDVPSEVPAPRLPAGYRSVGVEVTVKGQCRDCGRPVARRKRQG